MFKAAGAQPAAFLNKGTPFFIPNIFSGYPLNFHISVYNYCVQLYVVFSEYFLFTLLFLINFRKIMLRSLI